MELKVNPYPLNEIKRLTPYPCMGIKGYPRLGGHFKFLQEFESLKYKLII
jgi:hypothetical protein